MDLQPARERKTLLSRLLAAAAASSEPPDEQLSLPLGQAFLLRRKIYLDPRRKAWVRLELTEGGVRIEVQVQRQGERPGRQGADARHGRHKPWMEAGWRQERGLERTRWHVALRVAPPASAHLPLIDGSSFSLLPLVSPEGEVRAADVTPLVRWLINETHEACGAIFLPAMGEAARLLLQGAAHLVPRCDPESLLAAAPFTSSEKLRCQVYCWAVNDPSGRIVQLTRACPGVLIFAYALHALGRDQDCVEILQAVRQGARLGQVIRSAVRSWRRRAAREDLLHGLPEAWVRRTADFLPRRIRQAGAGVRPGALLSCVLPGLAAEDIPADPAENARWYEVTGPCVSDLFRGHARERLEAKRLRALGGFLSRHWWVLDAAAGQGPDGFKRLVGQLLDYLQATGRTPSRKTDPAALLEESKQWHERPPWEGDPWAIMPYAAGFSRSPTLKPRTPELSAALPAAGIDPWEGEGMRVVPLRTARELLQESRDMHHCVAMHVHAAVADRVQIFHATSADGALTVMTEREGGAARLRIIEASGACNRPPTDDEERALASWAATVQPCAETAGGEDEAGGAFWAATNGEPGSPA